MKLKVMATAAAHGKETTLQGLKDVEVLTYMDHNTIDAGYLKGMAKLTRHKEDKIAGWLHMSPRTMRNYKAEKKVFDKKTSEQVVMLRAVFEKGKAILGSAEAFDQWLDTTNFFFDGKKPITFLDTTSGLRYIFDRITAMEYGDNI